MAHQVLIRNLVPIDTSIYGTSSLDTQSRGNQNSPGIVEPQSLLKIWARRQQVVCVRSHIEDAFQERRTRRVHHPGTIQDLWFGVQSLGFRNSGFKVWDALHE
jgi:hypothetical protein